LVDIDSIGNILAKHESQNTQLTSFEKLREKIAKETLFPNKNQSHLGWSKSVRERKKSNYSPTA